MKYYFAPMHGITGYIYRNSYEKVYGNVDKYFTPFIVPNNSESLKTKEFRDVLPQNNKNLNVVPQILTDDSEGFVFTCRKLKQLGYNEVNLNLGCPSSVVVSKGRGSGFLGKREDLDRFLEEIFKIDDMKISIKTRIGKDNPEEFYELIKIYNKYPMEELIIHPRTQKDFYGNKPNLQVFKDAISLSVNPLCYNGDIFTLDDYNKFTIAFPKVESVMLGRGLLANPALISLIKNNIDVDKRLLNDFHDEVFNKYREIFIDDKNAITRMKELWGYMIYMFSYNGLYSKKIKEARNFDDYNEVVSQLFSEQEIIEGAGLFCNKNK